MTELLSVIIPCYNGAPHIKNGNIKTVDDFLKTMGVKYEIIVVNDGSTDDSLELLQQYKDIAKIVSYEPNRGKGYAIKEGMKAAKGNVLFMDIDLATSLETIKDLYSYDDTEIIIGSRNLAESKVQKKPLLRKLMSLVSRWTVILLTGIKEKDTQCGFKYIPKQYVDELVSKQIIDRWAFDVEYLYIAHKNGIGVREIPVDWTNGEDSVVSPLKSSIRFIKELFIIRKNKNNY